MTTEAPCVSVLVCTRNRRENVVPTVRSIQACSYGDFELLVLDQSADESTAKALAPACAADPRVKLFRLPRPGKPLALNEGLGNARGKYILLTDDDCEVAPDWMGATLAPFETDARVGCVYGTVDAAPHDPAKGYVPTRTMTRAHTIFGLRDFLTMPGWDNYGMGANMAVRADVIRGLGGWDACIGPGTRFGSGDDNDLAIRSLRAGHGLAFCPSSRVVHFGFRFWQSSRSDLSRRGYGLGAVFAKHLRCGAVFSGGLRAVRYEAGQCVGRLLRFERPRGVSFLSGWMRGFAAGLTYPIDRRTGHFVPDGDADAYHRQVAEVVLRAHQEADGDRPSP